jgi:hypothetical protein
MLPVFVFMTMQRKAPDRAYASFEGIQQVNRYRQEGIQEVNRLIK